METEFYKIISADAKNFTHKIRFSAKGIIAFEEGGEIEVIEGQEFTFGINEEWDFIPKQ